MQGPCKDCQKREVGCHGKCAEYATYRAIIDNAKAKRKAEMEGFSRKKHAKYLWNQQ